MFYPACENLKTVCRYRSIISNIKNFSTHKKKKNVNKGIPTTTIERYFYISKENFFYIILVP